MIYFDLSMFKNTLHAFNAFYMRRNILFKKFLITLYDIFPHYKGVSYQISYLPYFNDEFIGTHLDTNYVFTYFGKYEYLI